MDRVGLWEKAGGGSGGRGRTTAHDHGRRRPAGLRDEDEVGGAVGSSSGVWKIRRATRRRVVAGLVPGANPWATAARSGAGAGGSSEGGGDGSGGASEKAGPVARWKEVGAAVRREEAGRPRRDRGKSWGGLGRVGRAVGRSCF